MKIKYTDFNFRESSLKVIEQANEIIADYQAQGFDLTLRQLYYRFVAADLIPNQQKAYKRLGSMVNDGRLAGIIDWNSIVDRLRKEERNSHWSSPADIIESCAEYYAINTRVGQKFYIEVWVEKDALSSVVQRACEPLDVTWFACRGYVSQSAMWRAARRIKRSHQKSVILHLGDHDPSGIDMTRDIKDRLDIFGCPVDVVRIALNMDQVEEYGPPPNPAKVTDSRYADYQEQYGDDSWELDALEPQVLVDLIRDEIDARTDQAQRQALCDQQARERRQLRDIADNWSDIVDEYCE